MKYDKIQFSKLIHNYNYQDIINMVYESFSKYYNIFDIKKKIIINLINQLLKAEQSEICNFQILKKNKTNIGLICYYPVSEFESRTSFSTFLFFKNSINKSLIFKKLKKLSSSIQSTNGFKGLYLSRIYVNKKFRGKGFGDKLIKRFENTGIKKGYVSFYLHVYKSNRAAIKFYKRNGYKFKEAKKKIKYKIMTKTI